jgi:hypothetical protein
MDQPDTTVEEVPILSFQIGRQRQGDSGPRSPAASSHGPASRRGDRSSAHLGQRIGSKRQCCSMTKKLD